MKIEIREGRPPLSDIRDGLWIFARRQRRAVTFWLVITVLLAVASFCTEGFSTWFFIALFSVYLLGYIRFIYFPYRYPNAMMRNVAALGELVTVIDDTGILEQADAAKAFHTWDALTGYQEGPKGIVICFVGGTFKYIPKRLLSQEDLKELKQHPASWTKS